MHDLFVTLNQFLNGSSLSGPNTQTQMLNMNKPGSEHDRTEACLEFDMLNVQM